MHTSGHLPAATPCLPAQSPMPSRASAWMRKCRGLQFWVCEPPCRYDRCQIWEHRLPSRGSCVHSRGPPSRQAQGDENKLERITFWKVQVLILLLRFCCQACKCFLAST
eukprot:1144128-Pelagomonas_calceolata.AAC.9